MTFIFRYIGNVIIPIGSPIFQRGRYNTNQISSWFGISSLLPSINGRIFHHAWHIKMNLYHMVVYINGVPPNGWFIVENPLEKK